MNTLDFFTHGWITAIATGGLFVLGAVRLVFYIRDRRQQNVIYVADFVQKTETASGASLQQSDVTLLDYLTSGMPLKKRIQRKLCHGYYKIGLREFDHPSNNRYGLIEKTRQDMDALRDGISSEELQWAERLGIAKTRASEKDLSQINVEIGRLSSAAQIYANHVATEEELKLSIARDIGLGIPITDYTEVKNRLEERPPLAQVINDLPIPWQKIRDLPWRSPHAKTKVASRKPVRVPVRLYYADGRIEEDQKAEKDGEWIISKKLGIIYPYLGMADFFEWKNPNSPIKTGEIVAIDSDWPPEWDTKLLGKGGYLDQILERVERGDIPHSFRPSRTGSIVRWSIAGAFVLFTIVVSILQAT